MKNLVDSNLAWPKKKKEIKSKYIKRHGLKKKMYFVKLQVTFLLKYALRDKKKFRIFLQRDLFAYF